MRWRGRAYAAVCVWGVCVGACGIDDRAFDDSDGDSSSIGGPGISPEAGAVGPAERSPAETDEGTSATPGQSPMLPVGDGGATPTTPLGAGGSAAVPMTPSAGSAGMGASSGGSGSSSGPAGNGATGGSGGSDAAGGSDGFAGSDTAGGSGGFAGSGAAGGSGGSGGNTSAAGSGSAGSNTGGGGAVQIELCPATPAPSNGTPCIETCIDPCGIHNLGSRVCTCAASQFACNACAFPSDHPLLETPESPLTDCLAIDQQLEDADGCPENDRCQSIVMPNRFCGCLGGVWDCDTKPPGFDG